MAMAAALATLQVIEEENLVANAAVMGEYLMDGLQKIAATCPFVSDVRGKGLMIGAEIVKDPKTKEPGRQEVHDIMMKSFRRGLAVITSGSSTIRIAPPLIITRDLVDAGLDILEGYIKEVSKSPS